MKTTISYVAAVVVASLTCLHARSENSTFIGRTFIYTGSGATEINDPNAWEEDSMFDGSDCPGSLNICAITVHSTDVYMTGIYEGKPKVDIRTGAIFELSDDIRDSQFSTEDPYYATGIRIIYKKD